MIFKNDVVAAAPKVAGVFQGYDDADEVYTNDFYCAMTDVRDSYCTRTSLLQMSFLK